MLSLISYAASFMPDSPAGNNQIRVVQAAEPEIMEAGIAKAIAEIVAINATVPTLTGLDSPPWPADFTNGNKFVLADVALAGGGDGHTFALTMQFVRFAMASNTLLSQFLAGFLPSSTEGGATPVLNYSGPPNDAFGVINVDMNAWFDEFFDPAILHFKACLAADGASLQASFVDMVARLVASYVSPPLNGVLAAPWQSIAGAAKGTRMMAVVGGYQT